MEFSRIFKPEYFYQPQIAVRRLFLHQKLKTNGFIIENLPWRLKIRVDPQEEHGKILLTLGVIDLMVTETLWRLTEPGEIALDVGANIGYMTSVLTFRVASGGKGEVWSFEAHPEIFSELKFNIDNWQKELPNVQINARNIAISEDQGTVLLQIRGYAL